MTNPIVEISDGKLQGYETKTHNNKHYYVFQGIPYAKPPTGELRFLAPEPPEPWEGVRDATKNCNICAQLDRAAQVVIGDEDCLYLNVYTPVLPRDGKGEGTLPVMVFIHGGGFMYGDGTDASKHGPGYLVERDVILVSFNYRLGILGFLSLDRKDAPGNMGLKDQVQALKWVQKNISQFGGDPGNVTVFGVSAGGASVEYLLLSRTARGLFHKALKQSGSSLLHWAHNENIRDIIMKIPQIKDNNIIDDDQLLEVLKNMPYKDLIKASVAAIEAETDFKGGIVCRFVPTVEKPGDWEPFLDRPPYELLSRGEVARVPVVTGFCSREGLLVRAASPHVLEKLKQNKNFIDHLPFAIDDTQKPALEAELKTVYSESKSLYGEDDEYAIDFFSDVDFIGGIYVSALLLAKSNIPVYFYEFSYDGKLNYLKTKLGLKSPGACHGDDGGYVLTSAILPMDNISDTDKLVRDRMVAMFTNFAKYGDPTPAEDSVLPVRCARLAAAPAPARCLRVDAELAVRPFAAAAREQLLMRLYDGHYAPK